MSKHSLILAMIFGTIVNANAQILVDGPQTAPVPSKVGESAARKYFEARKPAESEVASAPTSSVGPRFLNIYVGTYLNDKQYRWGGLDSEEDVGQLIAGVNYRVGEWVNSMDLFFRGEFLTYDIDGKTPIKLSLSPVVAFPDASSGFPVYFGGGLGAGIFFEQVANESDLTLDYQIFTGYRQADLFDSFGLSFELGLKGHVNLLSSGQFSGVYYSIGTVHEF